MDNIVSFDDYKKDYEKNKKKMNNEDRIALDYFLAPEDQRKRLQDMNLQQKVKGIIEILVNDYQIKLKSVLDKLQEGKLNETTQDLIYKAKLHNYKNYTVYRLLELTHGDVSKKGLEAYKQHMAAKQYMEEMGVEPGQVEIEQQAEEFRRNSMEGKKTTYDTNRKEAKPNKNYIKTLATVVVIVGMVSGVVKVGYNSVQKDYIDNNFDQVIEYATESVPEFVSRNEEVEWVLGGVTQKEVVYRLYLVTIRDYEKKYDASREITLEWEKDSFRTIAQNIVDADRTGEIGRALDNNNEYFFGLLSKPGRARTQAIKEIAKDAGATFGGK